MPRRPQRPPVAGAPARPSTPPRPSSAPSPTPGTTRDVRRPGTADAPNTPENSRSSAGQGGPSRGSRQAAGQSPARGSGQAAGQGPARGSGEAAADETPPRGPVVDGGTAPRRGEHPRFSDFRRTAGQNPGTSA
nr:hypothetical protein [Streptomyces europaeiscabiei]